MKTITVFVGGNGVSGTRFVDALQRYTDTTCVTRQYADVAVVIRGGTVRCFYVSDGTDVSATSLAYLRGISSDALRHVLAVYLRSNQVPVVNSDSLSFQAMTKLEQYVVLALAGVPVPDSVFVASPDHYDKVVGYLGGSFPVVAKSITGSNGRDNVLIKDAVGLDTLAIGDPVFQAFIPNEFDYRVIVAGEEVLLAYKRVRSVAVDSYKNNIAQGGRREMTTLSPDLQTMAVQAAKALGREFAGIDIVTNSETGQSMVLEANFNFGTPVFDDPAREARYYRDMSEYFTRLML